jgi:hypothetical protein
MDRTTVSYPFVLNLLGVDGTARPLDAELRYTAADPLAVEALFDNGSDDPIRWVFARDLLADRPCTYGCTLPTETRCWKPPRPPSRRSWPPRGDWCLPARNTSTSTSMTSSTHC